MGQSKSQPISPHHPGLAEVLTDAFNRTIWELLRRASRATTVDELAARAGAAADAVRASLERLEGLGLVRTAFEPGTRRRTAYKIAQERLTLEYDGDDELQTRAVDEIRARIALHGRSVLETARVQSEAHGDRSVELHRSLHLGHDDFVELKRRIQAVTDFVEMIESGADGRPHLCNYHMAIEVRPLKELVLPTAMLHVVDGGRTAGEERRKQADRRDDPERGSRTKVLSQREREVARLLADGMSCPEISQRLVVSVNTVRTVTKRIYQKLGIRRRAELVNWVRGPSV